MLSCRSLDGPTLIQYTCIPICYRIPVKGVVANRTATYRKVALRVEWTGVKAYNASGTSGDKQYPSGKSWLRCLKEVFPEELHGVKCAVTGCPERAAVGAHVMVQSDPKDTCMRYGAK